MKWKIFIASLLPVFVLLLSFDVSADTYVDYDVTYMDYHIYGGMSSDYVSDLVSPSVFSFGQTIRYASESSLGYVRFTCLAYISGDALSGGKLAVPYSLNYDGDQAWFHLNFGLYDNSGVDLGTVTYYVPDGNNVVYIDIPDNVHMVSFQFDLSFDLFNSVEFTLSKPYFVASSSSDEFTTVLEEVQKQTNLQTDIKAEISQQTDLQQSVIDSADTAFDGVNDSVDTAVSEYSSEEAKLSDVVDATIGNFDFSNYLLDNIVGGFAPAMTFLSAQLTALFELTDFSAVFYVVIAISVSAILLGAASLWRR